MTIRSVGAGSIMGNLACRQKRADGRASPPPRVDPEAAPDRPAPLGDPPGAGAAGAGAGCLGGVESRAVVPLLLPRVSPGYPRPVPPDFYNPPFDAVGDRLRD